MALLKHEKIGTDIEVGVWKLEETEEWYLERLNLTVEELSEVNSFLPKKKEEWLASRWLLHEMSGREVRGKVLKDAFGKPHLEDSLWTISLSHSADCAAVLASANVCGVDIQRIEERILRMAPRFMSVEELENVDKTEDVEKIHVYWGAKEALFKLYSEGNVDFRKNLFVKPFEYGESGSTEAIIDMHDKYIECRIDYEKIEDYILVCAFAIS